MALRLSEGLGVVRERLKNMIYSLLNFSTRNLIDLVAATGVPEHDLTMDGDCVGKGVVSFSVVDVDGLPRRQDEHGAIEVMGCKVDVQLFFRER